MNIAVVVAALAASLVLASAASAAQRTACSPPPLTPCMDAQCKAGLDEMAGNVVEPKSGRSYFLDAPCGLKPGEKVLFILNLHGAGLSGAWQRRYFPVASLKDRLRLVVATPTAATKVVINEGSPGARLWQADTDDAYLHDIVDQVFARYGSHIRSFWLAGHSYGGMTANRLVCDGFFAGKVDGWLSLSGGRIGPAQVPPGFGPAKPIASGRGALPEGIRPGAARTPDCDFSYIFETGEKELVSLPSTSPWADRFGCRARIRREDVVDDKPGLVAEARPGREDPAFGRAARPGRAQVFVWSGCRDGRLVADVVRIDKGHTEGLEPRVTEALVRLMQSAPSRRDARVRRPS